MGELVLVAVVLICVTLAAMRALERLGVCPLVLLLGPPGDPQLSAVFAGVTVLLGQEVDSHVDGELTLLIECQPAHAARLLLQSDVMAVHVFN